MMQESINEEEGRGANNNNEEDPLEMDKGTEEPTQHQLASRQQQQHALDLEDDFEDEEYPRTRDDDLLFQRQRCPYTACAAGLLILANSFIFMLMIILGGLLGLMEDVGGDDYELKCTGPRDMANGMRNCRYYKKERKSHLLLLTLILAGQTVATIVTLYFVCKPGKTGRKLLRAGMAVFCCCCQKRKEYEEAVVPYSTLCEECCLGLRSCICGITLASMKLCFVPTLFALLFLFWNGIFSEGSDWAVGQVSLLLLLVIIGGMMWFLLWKFVLGQGHFLPAPEGENMGPTTSESSSEGNIEMA